jgi:hypothetical protein
VIPLCHSLLPHVAGMMVCVDHSIPKTMRVWKFPRDPFVTYQKRDEAWAVPLGFGRWEDEPVVYVLNGHTIVTHPDNIRDLRMKVLPS